jgi:acetylornithine deacetylase/succinyl-diaminopimelate desuccinylase-like protein
MPERDFAEAFGMQTISVPQPAPDDFYLFKDNGASVLAVAHLDTVIAADRRRCRFVETEGAGTMVVSGALDDRLGAYIILELLPKLGIVYDVLLTVGEESGGSTAQFFNPGDMEYDWIIEFDRGGTDVVMYQFEDDEVAAMVKDAGARVGVGSFSDIAYMEHLGIKAFNWGVGYGHPDHGPRCHAFLEDTFEMVDHYLDFHRINRGTAMPHWEVPPMARGTSGYSTWGSYGGGSNRWLDPADCDEEDWEEYPSLAAVNAAIAAMNGEGMDDDQ